MATKTEYKRLRSAFVDTCVHKPSSPDWLENSRDFTNSTNVLRCESQSAMSDVVSRPKRIDPLITTSFAPEHQSDQFETPFVFYDQSRVCDAVDIVRRNAGSAKILYSTK